MSSRTTLVALFAALALSLSSPARASVVEALDLETLVKDADDVVLARVIKPWSHYDERGRIVTDYTMQVERTEKGDTPPGAAITVRRLGGIVEGKGMRISGEPTFETGELVVLFGKRGGRTYLRPVGMAQGAMRVYEENGVRWARAATQGLSLVRAGDKSRAAEPPGPRKLDDLLADVHRIVEAQR